MKLAIPVRDGRLSAHFGQSSSFVIASVDRVTGSVVESTEVPAPAEGHGALPHWLKQQGVTAVIAGGIGGGAVFRLADLSIRVLAGPDAAKPADLLRLWQAGNLPMLDGRACEDHHGGGCGCGHGEA